MQKLPFMPHCIQKSSWPYISWSPKGLPHTEVAQKKWIIGRCCVWQIMINRSPYAHMYTTWVSIQIAFSIFHLLNQENRHVTNVLYSGYLVSLWEDILLKRAVTILLLYTSTASTDKISCSEQLVPQSRYLTVQAILGTILSWSLCVAADSPYNLYPTAAFISIRITFLGPDCWILLLLFWNGPCKT